jgi:hypothetical protein
MKVVSGWAPDDVQRSGMELWELIARESIRDLVTRYNSNGDTGRFAQVLELFTDDAVMELPHRSFHGRDEIATIFTDTRDQVSSRATPSYGRHLTATHQIDLVDETHATGRLYYAVISPIGLDHWGRYTDRYEVVDGTWKFVARHVTVDGRTANSLFSPEAGPQ